MTTPSRRKGRRIGPRLRAEAAVLEAAGVPKIEISRQLRVARESIRQFRFDDEGDLYERWVGIATRRLAVGVSRARIIDELAETVEVAPEELDPAAAWDAILGTARYLAGLCRAWNRSNHGEELLETDPALVLALAALHVGESEPGPGCSRCVGIGKAVLGASLAVASLNRDALIAARQRGAFIPLRPDEGKS